MCRVGPHVLARGRLRHRRVVDGAGEVRTVGEDVVEVTVGDAQARSDDAQEPRLQIEQPAMELDQHRADPGDGILGQRLVEVAVRVARAQRMMARHFLAPVEHLLPVGDVTDRRGLDEEPRVSGLAVTLGNAPPFLLRDRERKELGEPPVGLVEQVTRYVVTREHEPGTEAAHHPVDDRAPLRVGPLFERDQVDVEYVGHRHQEHNRGVRTLIRNGIVFPMIPGTRAALDPGVGARRRHRHPRGRSGRSARHGSARRGRGDRGRDGSRSASRSPQLSSAFGSAARNGGVDVALGLVEDVRGSRA